MTIRLATLHDRDQVLMLLNELGEVINERVQFHPDNVRVHELGKKNYEDAMQRADRRVFVVENNRKIIGVATFFIMTDFMTGKPFAHIDDFVIKKTFRGKGIGGRLIAHIKKYSKQQGIHVIKLTSSLQLTRAYRFYKKHGGMFSQRVLKFEV